LRDPDLRIARRIVDRRAAIYFWDAEWEKLEGQDILRVPGSDFAAIPVTGKKNARVLQIFNVKTREPITQVYKNEVREWLAKKAKDEGVRPTGEEPSR